MVAHCSNCRFCCACKINNKLTKVADKSMTYVIHVCTSYVPYMVYITRKDEELYLYTIDGDSKLIRLCNLTLALYSICVYPYSILLSVFMTGYNSKSTSSYVHLAVGRRISPAIGCQSLPHKGRTDW